MNDLRRAILCLGFAILALVVSQASDLKAQMQAYTAPVSVTSGELYEAGDPGNTITVTTAGTYYGWVSATADHLAGGMTADTSDATADHLTIPAVAGDYFISISASFGGSVNMVSECALFLDGVEHTSIEFKRKLSANGDVGSASASGIADLAASDELSFRCTADGNGDTIVMHRVNLSAMRLAN